MPDRESRKNIGRFPSGVPDANAIARVSTPRLGTQPCQRECALSSKWIVLWARRFRDILSRGFHRRWGIPAMTLASAFLAASCVGQEQTIDLRSLSLASGGDSNTQTAETVTQDGAPHPPTTDPSTAIEGSNAPDSTDAKTAAATGSAVSRASALGLSPGGRRVSLRPKDNVDADDLLDHWGHRRAGLLSGLLSNASEPNEDVDTFQGPARSRAPGGHGVCRTRPSR